MITITKQIYEEIAELLLEKIREKDFFNGTVEYDTDEFYSPGVVELRHRPDRWGAAKRFQLEHPEPIPRKPVLNIGDPAL